MKYTTFYVIIVSGVSLLLLIFCVLFWYTTEQKITTISPENAPIKTTSHRTFADISIKNITIKEFKKNKKIEVIVNAKESKFLQSSEIIECEHISCNLFDHKVQRAYFTADKALINREKKNIIFSGNILGQVKDLVIKGADAHYNITKQSLYTDKSTTYNHPDFYIYSQKSFFDLKNSRIELFDGVINEFILPDKQQQP
jgi:LPS export ABC transporter protein LptC